MSIKDLLITDGMIALFGAALDQIVSLKILKDEIYKSITDHRDKALKSVSADKNPYSSQTSNYDKNTIKLSNPYDATCHANIFSKVDSHCGTTCKVDTVV